MVKYKNLEGRPFLNPGSGLKTQCTGCVRNQPNIITCKCFIQLQISKGLKSCEDGFIYLEDNDG